MAAIGHLFAASPTTNPSSTPFLPLSFIPPAHRRLPRRYLHTQRPPHIPPTISSVPTTRIPFQEKNYTDNLKKILVLGSGPMVLGHGRLDQSGIEVCNALKNRGFEVVLINTNPATRDSISLDHDSYLTPITPLGIERFIAKEHPDALFPTMGAHALTMAAALADSGVLDLYRVQLLGPGLHQLNAFERAESLAQFKLATKNTWINSRPSGIASTLDQCFCVKQDNIGGYPLIVTPAFTLGEIEERIAYSNGEFESICEAGLAASLTSQVVIEKCLLGWNKYELEILKDLDYNVVVDSIKVTTPAQPLTNHDELYHRLLDYAARVTEVFRVGPNGMSLQFAVHPDDGEIMVTGMDTKVFRSSILSSKAKRLRNVRMTAKSPLDYIWDGKIGDSTTVSDAPASCPSIGPYVD